MTLSARQLSLRRLRIGASEWAAVMELDRWRTPLDVWAEKRRGAHGQIAPIVPEPAIDEDKPDAFKPFIRGTPWAAGHVLERGIVELYQAETGARVKRSGTKTHPDFRMLAATPDRLVLANDNTRAKNAIERGLECKLVGEDMAEDWIGDALPHRVWIQCQANMSVTGLERWDAAALIGGTKFRINRVVRDESFIRDAEEFLPDWWRLHVEGDEPPEPRDAKDLQRFTRRRWEQDDGTEVDLRDGGELAKELAAAVPLMLQLARFYRARRNFSRHMRACRAKLEALLGPRRSFLLDGVGRFVFSTHPGQISYKDLAEELNGGGFDEDALDEHRGEPFRKSQLHEHKPNAKRSPRRRRPTPTIEHRRKAS